MSSYTTKCLDYCKQQGYEASEEGRAQLLDATRASCQQIQQITSKVQSAVDQHQRSSTRTPPRTPPRTGSNNDADELDQLDKELDDLEAQAGNHSEGRRSRGVRDPVRGAGAPARGSGAPARYATRQPQGWAQSPTAGGYRGCSSVCGRISQCGLMESGHCNKLCADAGSHWSIDQGKACSAIKQELEKDQWSCWAEASVGTRVGNMPYVDSTKSLGGNGRTRAEAANQALRNCNAIVSGAQNLAWLDGQSTRGGQCEVTRCEYGR